MNPKWLTIILMFLLMITNVNWAQPEYNPVADPAAIVEQDQVRFTVLTPRVIRMEWSENGKFEDRASLVFVNRRVSLPRYEVTKKNGWLQIKTDLLTLFYLLNSGRFTEKNLRIEFTMNGQKKIWHPGMPNTGNLHGTIRTLDQCDGNIQLDTGKPIDLGEGLISRDGWALIDDSRRPLFDNSHWPWVTPRPQNETQDWYFFGYGHDYKLALHDFVELAGKIPIPPRFAFGIWWSRYWEYTDKELRELVNSYHSHNIPLDVLVVDIDWHLRFQPGWFDKEGHLKRDQAGQRFGWTGYTWDKNYFPDPEDFLDWTERQKLKVCLNLHPASGIQPHEAAYTAMARAMGIDPATRKYIPFDIVNKKYAENYMRLVLHPLEKIGVDFWWLDWQQWSTTRIPGVNPTFYLNYVFFSDMERQGQARPLILHRYGGLGNHRYQIGFSGDAVISWGSLDYQPYFTATAANVCFGYWSHDIGGHTRGDSPPELYTRWIQWGAFSPIFRTHATKRKNIERRIWAYPLPFYKAMRQAMLWRHSLIPYMYTQARKTFETGVAFLHPLYYEFPNTEIAYQFPNEYLWGDDIIVRPVTHPIAKDSLAVPEMVWLPPGQWFEWSTGTILNGNQIVNRTFMLDEVPVYVRAGAIVPMQKPLLSAQVAQPDPLVLVFFPGDSGHTEVYEDEGNTNNYWEGQWARTPVSFHKMNDETYKIVIDPVKGHFPGMVNQRSYLLQFPLTWPASLVILDKDTLDYSRYDSTGRWTYSGEFFGVQLHTPELPTNQRHVLQIRFVRNDRFVFSGMKGKMHRLMKVAKFLATYREWNRYHFPKQPIAGIAQTGLALEQHPERAKSILQHFPERWKNANEILSKAVKSYPELRPYIVLLRDL